MTNDKHITNAAATIKPIALKVLRKLCLDSKFNLSIVSVAKPKPAVTEAHAMYGIADIKPFLNNNILGIFNLREGAVNNYRFNIKF